MNGNGERESPQRPEDIARLMAERFNSGDIDGIVALYEPEAVISLPGSGVVRGQEEIRNGWERLKAMGATVDLEEERPALRSGDLALTSRLTADGTVNVEVARRQPDGSWRWVIDQPNATKW
ncbi:hypothetical protein GCM10012275_46330 [Longimycelium tulufanense]|uniref:SnoaL-like domain-containing protein n=1 Tax=Longimycelium tulufanense TaxID=907463 RepID=A0A8J3FYB7_9PSEU|nr:nuclear transport factor 2 family protein [Longimycelium tulufanense]GGM70652.1 hypothetical protein GCM10012275_46330 [Longimycelium tulufanense]